MLRRVTRRCSATSAIEMTIRIVLSADAMPGLPPISLPNCMKASVASTLRSRPIRRGVPKSAIDSTKVSSAAAVIDGRISGNVTVSRRRSGETPRLSAASSTERFTAPSALETMRKTCGKNLKANTRMTPVAPYMVGMETPSSVRPLRTTPLAPNSTIQA